MSIEWVESYKMGIANIDKQHQHLFELTNALLEVDNLPGVRALIMQLYKHTREHFELEEDLMRKMKYPGTEEHIGYHNALLDRLNDISNQVGKGQLDRLAIEKLMTDWALRHVPNDDAMIASFLRKQA
jgi:hemerythrin